MGNSTENNNKNNFLNEGLHDGISKLHKEYLGTDIPEGYFAKSKLSILNKIKEESPENNFLQEATPDFTKHHKDYLGTHIPENYFSKSKQSILDKISKQDKEEVSIDIKEPKKQVVFYLRPQFKYMVAASLVFLFSLTIWLQNSNDQNNFDISNIESIAFADDVLIESLLIEDKDLDAFADATLFNEVLVKAEISEQKMDNLILNTLILEDSLLDDYMDDELIETIIL